MNTETVNNSPAANDDPEYPENPQEFAYQVRKKLARLLLNRLHSQPVRDLGGAEGFGGWISLTRKRAHLTELDLAAALDIPEASITEICSDDFLPWTSSPDKMADLMILFRLHFESIKELASAFQEGQGQPGNAADASVRRPGPKIPLWLDDLRQELRARHSEELIN